MTPPPLPKKQRWFFSPLFLIGLNVFIPFVVLVSSSYYNPFALIIGGASVVFYGGICAVWHGPVYYFDTRKRIPDLARVGLYLLPTIMIFLMPALGIRFPQAENEKSPSLSPSGRYEAKVWTEREGWIFRFKEKSTGEKVEVVTEMVPHLSVYWHWIRRIACGCTTATME